MKTISSQRVGLIRSRRRVASSATLVASICVAFVALISLGLFWGVRSGVVLPARQTAALDGLMPLKPDDQFSQTRIGQLLYWPAAGNECRRVLYDNRTSMIQEAGIVACEHFERAPEPPAEGDRMMALRKAFQK